jgi:sulfite reductase (NADPH) hemoprotein beta-component
MASAIQRAPVDMEWKAWEMDGMVTANRLGDGLVVFLTAQGGWSEDFHLGAVVTGETAKAAALALGAEAVEANVVVDPYWIDLELRGGHYVPKALREAIRASGPTTRRDLGKQAANQAPDFLKVASTEG